MISVHAQRRLNRALAKGSLALGVDFDAAKVTLDQLVGGHGTSILSSGSDGKRFFNACDNVELSC